MRPAIAIRAEFRMRERLTNDGFAPESADFQKSSSCGIQATRFEGVRDFTERL